MTSRERFLAAVDQRQPDRTPIDMKFAAEVQHRLRGRLGLDEPAFWEWIGQDLWRVGPGFPAAASELRYADPTVEVTTGGLHIDVWGVPFRRVTAGEQTYMELAGRPPLAKLESVDQLDEHPWPDAGAWDYSTVPAQIDAGAEKACWGHSRGFFEIAHFMRGMDAFLTDLALRPELAGALMDRVAECLLARARATLEAGGGRLAFFEYNDDVASQRATFIAPAMWREHVRPRMARFCALADSFGAKVRYHCCGYCRAIIDDLIDIGVDVLEPVQPAAAGMDPLELKAAFGGRITLNGGVDIQHLLPNASPAEVRRHVRRLIDVVGAGGGYVLGPSHSIQSDVPDENIIAMVEAATV